MNSNRIAIDGGVALANYLKSEKCTLNVLNLNSNRIDNVGGHEMAMALRINRTLSSLNVMSNNIGDDSLFQLAKTLLHFNSTIKKVRVLNNKFDQKSMSLFHDIAVQLPELSIDIVIDKVDKTYYVAQKKSCIKPDPTVNTTPAQIIKIEKLLEIESSLDGFSRAYERGYSKESAREPDEYDIPEQLEDGGDEHDE
jgi:hypothetical protein